VTLEFGNYPENIILNNAINLTNEGKLLKARRKRNTDNQANGMKKSRSKKSILDNINKDDSIDLKSQKIKESHISMSENRANDLSLKEENEDNMSLGKSESDNILLNTFTGNGVNSFNDEAFENIIKEFLNINKFPTESKEKINLLKKFISIYKKIKDDKTKLGNFLIKISDKLKEPYDEIQVNSIIYLFIFNLC